MSARTICGAYHRGGTDPGTVAAMLTGLPGQGSAGSVHRDAVSFGWRALQAGAGDNGAPKTQFSSRGSIVAAARLDNRAELSDALALARPERAGIDDDELILRAYERWGGDCPLHLQGDYAFAIWDAAERLLFCARDAVGARPLYYSLGPGRRFAFASDIGAVLAAPGLEDRLDDDYVVATLMGGAPPGSDGTFYSAVRSLPPGHSISVSAGAERIRRWWRPEDAPPVRLGSDGDYAREFLELYRLAVRDRLRDSHPLGVHLSGGLDSSSIAALAARELRPSGRRPEAFCWHPPPDDSLAGEEAAEYRLIESICAQEGLEPRYHSVSAEHMLARLRLDGARFPDRDGTLLHESLVQRSAAELGVRVILSGWGGDEVASNSGAGYYAELLRGGRFGQLLQEARRVSNRPWRFVARHAVLPQVHFRAADIVAGILRGKIHRRPGKNLVHPALAREFSGRRNPNHRAKGVRQTQLANLGRGHLARRIEDWAAHGARMGIEYRYPLLDRRLLEFVLGLPAEQFRHGRRSRWFMRRALRPVLPEDILERSVKSDPARSRLNEAARNEALAVIIERLATRPELPVRAKYLDMRKLPVHLEMWIGGSNRVRAMALLRSLQFLDWQTG